MKKLRIKFITTQLNNYLNSYFHEIGLERVNNIWFDHKANTFVIKTQSHCFIGRFKCNDTLVIKLVEENRYCEYLELQMYDVSFGQLNFFPIKYGIYSWPNGLKSRQKQYISFEHGYVMLINSENKETIGEELIFQSKLIDLNQFIRKEATV